MEKLPLLHHAIMHFAPCVFLLCGLLLWMRRDPENTPRLYLSYSLLFAAFIFMLRLYAVYKLNYGNYQVLSMPALFSGLLCLYLLYLYPIRTLSVNWFNKKSFLLYTLPLYLIFAGIVFQKFKFRPLYDFQDIIQYADEWNVWFRFLVLLACILPYSLIMLTLPYNWKASLVSGKWILRYSMALQGVCILFVLFTLTALHIFSSIHMLYCMMFSCYITYYELFCRMEVSKVKLQSLDALNSGYVSDIENPLFKEESAIVEQSKDDMLWDKLVKLMDSNEIWRNPDVHLSDLASEVGTNRTTLSNLIQSRYIGGYREFINKRRIEEFVKVARLNKNINIQDTFYDVGFRSRMTAFRYFKEYMGMTPTEYLQKGDMNN